MWAQRVVKSPLISENVSDRKEEDVVIQERPNNTDCQTDRSYSTPYFKHCYRDSFKFWPVPKCRRVTQFRSTQAFAGFALVKYQTV